MPRQTNRLAIPTAPHSRAMGRASEEAGDRRLSRKEESRAPGPRREAAHDAALYGADLEFRERTRAGVFAGRGRGRLFSAVEEGTRCHAPVGQWLCERRAVLHPVTPNSPGGWL